MSDRYLLDSGDYYCADCASVVRWPMRPKHDAFHARIDLMYDAIPASMTPPACAMCGGVGMHKAGCALTPTDSNDSVTAALEPPVGSVVRCEGCGNVYVHKRDGWVDTDSRMYGIPWDKLQRPSCGPLRVVYTPGSER